MCDPKPRSTGPPIACVAVLSMAVVALVTTGAVPSGAWPGSRSSSGATPDAATPSLVGGPLVAVTPSTFWSADYKTHNSTGIWTDAVVRTFLNQSPFVWAHYGALSDECNISANVQYWDNGSTSTPCAFNLTAFKLWCTSMTPHCRSIVPLPGENNDSSEDGYIANWIVHTVGFQPDYWNVGNEPDHWRHYGIPWAKWQSTDHRSPTPLAYAVDLKNAIRAVRSVDPSAKFVGIEAACGCDQFQMLRVVQLDGANISALAYHLYPSQGHAHETLQQFLDPLSGGGNVSGTYGRVKASVAAMCPNCSAIPIFVQEYNAGPSWNPSVYGGTYANALFLAASTIQALRANVTMFTIFSLQSQGTKFGYSMLDSADRVGPTGLVFSGILDHLATGNVYALRVATHVPSVWSVLTESPHLASLLVVNANLTQSVKFYLGPMVRAGATGTVYSWSPSRSAPTSVRATLASSYTVPAEGILLIDLPVHAISSPAAHGGSPVPATAPGATPAARLDRRRD